MRNMFAKLAVVALGLFVTLPAFSAERLTAASPKEVLVAYAAFMRVMPILPQAQPGQATAIAAPIADNGFVSLGALPHTQVEHATVIIGPPVANVPCFNCVSGTSGSVGSIQSLIQFNRNVVTEMNIFFHILNYTGSLKHDWAIVRLPSTIINGGTFTFNVTANTVQALAWDNVVIPSQATAGDALVFSKSTAGANSDTWYQFIRLI